MTPSTFPEAQFLVLIKTVIQNVLSCSLPQSTLHYEGSRSQCYYTDDARSCVSYLNPPRELSRKTSVYRFHSVSMARLLRDTEDTHINEDSRSRTCGLKQAFKK